MKFRPNINIAPGISETTLPVKALMVRLSIFYTQTWNSVSGGPAVPEPGTEVVTACHEAWVSGRVNNAAHNIIMAKWEQVFPFGCARVPTAQADRSLIGQQHVVLGVVKDTLSAVRLTATQSCSCNTHITGDINIYDY